MDNKNISLYGFYGIDNIGNEAMLRALIEPIRNVYGNNMEFKVFSRHPDLNYDKIYGCKTVKNLEHDNRDQATGRWLRGLNPDDSIYLSEFARNIAFSDLVIVGPGQYFVETGVFGLFRGSLSQVGILSQLCKMFDVPLYGVALACETINNPWSVIVIQEILDNMVHKNFRDPVSVENLHIADVDLPDAEVLGDIALAPEPSDIKLAAAVFEAEGIPAKKGPRLALAHRNLYFLKKKDQVEKAYAEALQKWLEDEDRDIIAIPQSSYNRENSRDDDSVAAENLMKMIGHGSERIHFIKNERRPEVIESLYGACDITLASRLHGSVFSCRQGTPPLVLNCMKKMEGFYKRLGFEQFLISPDADAETIISGLEHILKHREKLSKEILDRVSENRKTAKRYAEIAIDIIREIKPSSKNLRVRKILGLN